MIGIGEKRQVPITRTIKKSRCGMRSFADCIPSCMQESRDRDQDNCGQHHKGIEVLTKVMRLIIHILLQEMLNIYRLSGMRGFNSCVE